MKHIVYILCVLVLFTSCSLSRKLNKQKHETSNQTELQTDVRSHIEDKSTTKTVQTIDTSIVLPGQKISSESIGTSTKTIVGEDTLSAYYDKVSNTIKAAFSAPRKKIPVHEVKSTEQNNNIVQDVVAKKDSTNKQGSSDLSKVSDVKTSNVWFWIILIVVSAGVIFLAFKYGKPLIKKLIG